MKPYTIAPMTQRAYFSLTWRLIIAVVLFLLGLFFGQVASAFLPGAHPDLPDQMDLAQGYHFIDPLLLCSDHELTGQTAAFSNMMQSEISDAINESKQNGNVTDASVYWRDLSTGSRVVVNPTMTSEPASLLKVALALSIHRKAEADPSFLQKTVVMNIPDQDGGQHFAPPNKAESGKTYTIAQLLDLSTVDSDNNATDLLITQLTDSELRHSYTDLGIQVPVDNPSNYTLDVATYASFFRVLYNASYLTRADSEEFLLDLSRSTFTKGIVSGLPTGTVVSHKFGEFSTSDNHSQLHDCGIVYKPNHPYLLCIMTKGNDFDKLANTIASISKVVWDAQ